MDIVTVGLRVKDDGTVQLTAFGNASEAAAKRIAELETQLNKMGGAHTRASAAGEGHRLATGKISRALEGMIVSATGANAHIGTLSVALSDMALGGAVVTGVLAGVAAVSFAYEKLTQSAREAKKEQDDLIASFEKAQRLKAAGGPQGATVTAIQNRIDDASTRITRLTGLSPSDLLSPDADVVGAVAGHLSDEQKKQLAHANADLKAATAERDAIYQKAAQDTDNAYAQNLAALIGFNAKDKALREQGLAIMHAWEKTLAQLPSTDLGGRAQLAGNITALQGALFPKDDVTKAARDAKEYSDAIDRAKKATVEMALAQAKSSTAIEQQNTQALRLRDAAFAGAEAFQKASDEIDAENQLAAAGISIFDARYDALRREIEATRQLTRETAMINQTRQDLAAKDIEAAKKAAAEKDRINENLIRQMQDTWLTFFENTLTTGLKSFRDLFSGIKTLFVKLISDMLAANVMSRLTSVFGGLGAGASAGSGGSGGSGGMLSGLGAQIAGQGLAGGLAGGIVGYAVGGMTGSAAGGAITGAASGALTGAAVAGPIGALAGGLTGLVGGLLGGARAAREAAEAMKQLKKDYDTAVESFKHNDLGAALAQNAADAEHLRKMAEDIWGPLDKILKAVGLSSQQLADALADVNAQEQANADRLKRQDALNKKDAQDSLQVRLLRAQGQGDAADRLAFDNAQAHEWQQAIIDNRDATYMNTLATVQAAERIAELNGTLQDAERNSPNGFRVDPYLYDFQTPRTSDPFNTGMPPLNQPNGTGPASGSGLTPPGGSNSPPTSHPASVLNLTFAAGSIVVDGSESADEVVDRLVDRLDSAAAALNGRGSSRVPALDALKKRRGR
jgi:PAS domain-containing protein